MSTRDRPRRPHSVRLSLSRALRPTAAHMFGVSESARYKAVFQIYTLPGYNRGTYRYRAEGDTVIGETCGPGGVCDGQSSEDTEWVAAITPSGEAPDPRR